MDGNNAVDGDVDVLGQVDEDILSLSGL